MWSKSSPPEANEQRKEEERFSERRATNQSRGRREVLTVGELKNDSNVLVRLDDIEQTNDVRMFDVLQKRKKKRKNDQLGPPLSLPPSLLASPRELTFKTLISLVTLLILNSVSRFPLLINLTATSSP